MDTGTQKSLDRYNSRYHYYRKKNHNYGLRIMKKRSSQILCCVIMLMLGGSALWQCGKGYITDKGSAIIRGFVLDKSTSLPIDWAWIITRDTTSFEPRTYTDTNGYFQYVEWAGPSYDLFVGKSGYRTEHTWIDTKSDLDTLHFLLHSEQPVTWVTH